MTYNERISVFYDKFFDEYYELLESGVIGVIEGTLPVAKLLFAYPSDVFKVINIKYNGEPFILQNKVNFSRVYKYEVVISDITYVLECNWYYGWDCLFYRKPLEKNKN
jgi:hypothetical protein